MPFNVNSAAIVALRDSGRFSTSQIQSIIARANQIEINQAAGQPTLRLAGVANELVSPALGEFTSAAYSDVVRQRIQDAVNGIDPVGLSVFIERDGRFYPSLDGSDLPNGAMYAVPISSYVTASMPIDRVKPQIVVGDWALLPNISLVELKSKFDHEVSHVIRDLIQKNGQVVASVLAETSLNLNQRFEKLLRVNLDDEATALIAEFNSRRRSGQSDAENDATAGNTDVLSFASGIAADQLWFSHAGNDLEVSIIGTADKFTVQDWYSGSQHRVERIKAGDNKVLLDTQVEALVQAMAGFAPPAMGQTTLAAAMQTSLAPVFAANWS